MNIDYELSEAHEMLEHLPYREQSEVREYIDILLEFKYRGFNKLSMLQLRKHIPLTQKQLSEISGISVRTISRTEKGIANPTIERKLCFILMAFGLEKGYFARAGAILRVSRPEGANNCTVNGRTDARTLFNSTLRGVSASFPAQAHFFLGGIGVVSGSCRRFYGKCLCPPKAAPIEAQDSRLAAPSLFRTLEPHTHEV